MLTRLEDYYGPFGLVKKLKFSIFGLRNRDFLAKNPKKKCKPIGMGLTNSMHAALSLSLMVYKLF